MTRLFALTFLISALLSLPFGEVARAEINTSGVVGFQAWKQLRLDEAKAELEKLKAVGVDPKKGPQDPARRKLLQAQLNVDINEELGITDYFTFYLSQLKDRSSFIDAAKKLSPEDTADLMMAYQKSLTPPQSVPASPTLRN